MAIEKENLTQPGQTGSVQATQPQQQAQPQSRGWSFTGMTAPGGISRAPSSEVLTHANTAIIEVLTKLNVGYTVQVLKVDNTKETSLRLSSIVLVLSSKQGNVCGYHTILLEGSSTAMPPRLEQHNGQQVVIDRFAADVNDVRYAQIIGKLIQSAFPGYTGKECSATVAPRIFNWDDKDAVRTIVNNGLLACASFLETRMPGWTDLNLGDWNRSEQLQAEINFNESTSVDYVGLPVRSDTSIVLSANSTKGEDQSTLNNQERSQPISQVKGFFDLLWSPTQEAVNPYGAASNVPQHKFAIRFVMTSMESVQRMTPGAQALALAAVLQLGEGTNWYPAFLPRSIGGSKNVDMRDIGAINIEANVFNDPSGYGTKIVTKSASFNQLELGQLIQRTIRPGLSVSLDVSSCGSDTWYNEPYAAAASGHPGSIEVLLKATNTLTGGNFSKHYKSGASPVMQNDEQVLLGYFTGQDGTRHDIREIDYIAVMNLIGENSPVSIQAWSDTFSRLDYPLAKRLEERKKMICQLIGTEVTFTQLARRVTFTSEYLAAFAMALRDIQLVIKPINSAMHGEYVNSRGQADWTQQTAMGTIATGLYQTGYYGAQQQAATHHWGNSWGVK